MSESGSGPAASAQHVAEQVQAIIPNTSLKPGFMRVGKRYTLILTTQRVILARSTLSVMKKRAASAWGNARSEGEGLLGQLSAYLTWVKRYLDTPPDQALAESTDNFAIERSAITKTSVKTKTTGRWTEYEYRYDLLIINTRGRKYQFELHSGRDQATRALQDAGMSSAWQRLAKSLLPE